MSSSLSIFSTLCMLNACISILIAEISKWREFYSTRIPSNHIAERATEMSKILIFYGFIIESCSFISQFF